MPIYEYRCEACGHYLDALQKVSDAALKDCPECESASLKRLISAPSFRLKGSGWYETDFKSDKERRRNLAGGAEGRAAAKAEDGNGKGKDDKSSSDAKSASGDSSKSDSGKSDSGGSKGSSKTGSNKGTGTEAA